MRTSTIIQLLTGLIIIVMLYAVAFAQGEGKRVNQWRVTNVHTDYIDSAEVTAISAGAVCLYTVRIYSRVSIAALPKSSLGGRCQ